MINVNVGSIRDPLKQDLALDLAYIRNNWLGLVSLSPGSSHKKEFIAQLHLGLEGVTEVDTDPKGRFVSFKGTLSNNRVLCFCAP